MPALKLLSVLAILLLFANSVFALGISEGRIALNFTPSMERNLSITVINNENRTINVVLFARDNVYHEGLARYVTLYNMTATIPPKANMPFTYNIKLPSWLAGPKTYDTRIGAIEVPEGGGIGAVAGSEQQLWITVPNTTRPDIVTGEIPYPPEPVVNNTNTIVNNLTRNNLTNTNQRSNSGPAFILAGGALMFVCAVLLILIKRGDYYKGKDKR